MTVLLRPPRAGDTPALVDVFVSAFQHGYPDVLPADVLASVTPEAVTGWFERWTVELTTTVAEQGGTVAGFVRYGPDEDDPEVGYVAALYVHPRASGSGIGRRLLEHAIGELGHQGMTAVRLWVFQHNARARGLYESAGFAPDGTEATDPQWRVPQIRLRRDAG